MPSATKEDKDGKDLRKISDDDLRDLVGVDRAAEEEMERRAREGSPDDEEGAAERLQNAEEAAASGPSRSGRPESTEQDGLANQTSFLDKARQQGVRILGVKPKRNNLLFGGGTAAVIVGILILFFSLASVELVNWRENMIGKGNEIANTVLSARNDYSFARLMRKMRKGAGINPNNTINNRKFQQKFEQKGYRVVFAEDGKLQEFSKLDEDGNVSRSFNLDTDDTRGAYRSFTEGDLGKVIRQDVKDVMLERAGTWKGRQARKLWRSMRVRFTNWADRTPSDKADTDEEKFAENLRAEEADQSSDPANRTRAGSDDAARDADGNGEPDPGSELSDPSTDLGQEAEEYREALLDDPSVGDEVIDGVVDNDLVNELTDQAGGTFGAVASGGSEQAVRDALGDIASRMPGKLAGAALTGISVTDWYNRLCRVKGTLLFVANVRNVLLTLELAKFTVKFLTLSDHQKAGALSSEGLKLTMLYLHHPNPLNGRGYYESGGIQNLIGNSDAKVNQADLGRYSTGRANAGILAQVASFIETNPLARTGVNPTACRITNNGFVQLAGAGLGIVIAVFGGAETGFTETQIAISIGLAVAEELVFQISKPLLLKVGSRMLFHGLERNGEQVGNGLASGMGALKGMNGGANGLKPVTWDQAATIRQAAQAEREQQLAMMNPFERYFGMENPDSLTNQAYFAAPKNFSQLFGRLPSLIQPEKLAGGLFGSLMPKQEVLAQTTSQCTDTWIQERNLATDAFCNVEMGYYPFLNVDETEQILLDNSQIGVDGTPIPESEYDKYLDKCHEGTPTVVYNTEVSDSGVDDARQTECLDAGEPFPGDSIGRNDRFTNFYGYTTDEANISENINDKYVDVSEEQAAPPTSGTALPGGPCPTEPVGREAVVNPIGSLSNILVHTCVVQQVNDMQAAAAADGTTLTASNSWRDPQQQIRLREEHCGSGYYNIYLKPSSQCSPPTATPGNSRHERGVAIDFSSCNSRSSPCFRWLDANAQRFGYTNLPSEPWHWSIDGR